MSESILGLTPPPTRREQLAEFLRHLRERSSPESVGLTVEGRRRTPGLRREEVSQLSGVGLSWYTWLEQGRDITPSPQVLDALARVFSVTGPERRHLYDLAGVAIPAAEDRCISEAPVELAAWIAALHPLPAYLINARTDLLAVNPGAELIIGLPAPGEDGTGNLLRWLFTGPAREQPMTRTTARYTLARFRAAHARHYDDPDFRALIEELLTASPAFRELWPRHEVLDSQIGVKEIDHPRLGRLAFRHLQSIPSSHPDLRLTQLTPADASTRRALGTL